MTVIARCAQHGAAIHENKMVALGARGLRRR